MIRVHGTLYTLQELRVFPFDDLYAPGQMEFWRLVVVNFLDYACLALHGLVKDQAGDAHTIRKFKGEVVRAPWRDKTQHKSFKEGLGKCGFDPGVEDIGERVAALRNNRIAHRLLDKDTGGLSENFPHPTLDELRHLYYATQFMFGALSFGSAYSTLAGDLSPGTVGGKPTRTSIDKVLDGVLRESNFVNKPERRGQWWPTDRQHMHPKQLERMNELRKRVGLPAS
jgi:hypothetical protein